MALSDLIRKIHGPEQLSAAIDLFILKREEEDRSDAWHPSSFKNMCPRREVIKTLLGIEDGNDSVEPRTRRIWDIGSIIHAWYQNCYLGPMGILWGKWQCIACDNIYWGFMPKKDCLECKREKTWRFKEVPIRAKLPCGSKPIIGHSDGLLNLPIGWTVWEGKSANERSFNMIHLEHPYVQDAIKQGQTYGQLIREECVPVPKGVKIPKPEKLMVFYINKNMSLEKEFLVDLDEDLGKTLINAPVKYERAMEKKVMPDKWVACSDIKKEPACNCEVRKTCFNDLSWEALEALR